jgi:hypothetical protein
VLFSIIESFHEAVRLRETYSVHLRSSAGPPDPSFYMSGRDSENNPLVYIRPAKSCPSSTRENYLSVMLDVLER